MFWTLEKLAMRNKELSSYRYREPFDLTDWDFIVDAEKANGIQTAPEMTGQDVLQKVSVGDRWEGRDLYVWLSKTVHVPDLWRGRQIVGLFDFGKTGGGNNSGFESLLYINGKPYQGVDQNHQEVFLSDDMAGETLAFQFRLWSGLEGGGVRKIQEHRFQQAQLALLDEPADNLYYTTLAALQTVKELAESCVERELLLRLMNRAFNLLDWARPGSESFYHSVKKADECLRIELAALKKEHGVTVTCVGHTHIDVAWLWRLAHTREKAARSFSTVLKYMEMYPEYIFVQSQPQLYDYLKTDYPEIYEKVKQRVKEGRWEPGGAMWLEADCNLTSGESLVRQILYGKRFFLQEFGVDCGYLWLPDVFGYSWALPQILRKSGVKTFMTTKISWNQYNRMPHDTFKWRGIDGSEVLTHFVTTPDGSSSDWKKSNPYFYTYNGLVTAETIQGSWNSYRDKGLNQDLLLSYGYGDGGGGPTREMLELRRRLDQLPGIPHAKAGRVGEFFDKLHQRVEQSDDYVHTWDGELYLEYHRGTYTSQAQNKKLNRRMELLFREAEWMQTFRSVLKQDWSSYPQTELYNGWKIILRNQFHDIIPGSSIREVYEDSQLEYAEAATIGNDALFKAEAELVVREENTVTVWNSASFSRAELVSVPMKKDWEKGEWFGSDGEKLAAEVVHGDWLIYVPSVAPCGTAELAFKPNSEAKSVPNAQQESGTPAFIYSEQSIESPHYVLRWNENGQLVRIYDKAADREVLSNGERGNVLQIFEDKPMNFDAWEIDIFYQQKMEEITVLKSIELLENGAQRAVIRFVWSYGDSKIEQRMTLYAHSRRIDFLTNVDWQERQKLLKVAFPVSVRATEATFDIQFGNVKRPTHWNTSWDMARFETVGHQWADLSEHGYGVSLLNDCKYGHDVKDHTIRLSLLKSAIYPDPEADLGEHQFTYSLLPHQGRWLEGGTVQEAWGLNNPLKPTLGKGLFESDKSLFRISNASEGHVQFDAIKKAEDQDAVILRIHEYAGGRGKVELISDFAAKSWQECDLMEQPISEETTHGQGNNFEIKPYEIKTFLVRF